MTHTLSVRMVTNPANMHTSTSQIQVQALPLHQPVWLDWHVSYHQTAITSGSSPTTWPFYYA